MSGKQFNIVLDTYAGTKTGMEMVDGKGVSNNETTKHTSGHVLKLGQTQQIVCTVRKNQLIMKCDDQTWIDWTGDPARLSAQKYWAVPKHDQLFVAARNSRFEITKLELKPLEAPAPK